MESLLHRDILLDAVYEVNANSSDEQIDSILDKMFEMAAIEQSIDFINALNNNAGLMFKEYTGDEKFTNYSYPKKVVEAVIGVQYESVKAVMILRRAALQQTSDLT